QLDHCEPHDRGSCMSSGGLRSFALLHRLSDTSVVSPHSVLSVTSPFAPCFSQLVVLFFAILAAAIATFRSSSLARAIITSIVVISSPAKTKAIYQRTLNTRQSGPKAGVKASHHNSDSV